MHISITARHLNLTPSLSDYAQRKIEKVGRHFNSIVSAQIILTIEKLRHIAEVVVHVPGSTFSVKGVAGDLYSSIDLASHKIDLHLSRVKDRMKEHRPKGQSRKISKPTSLISSEDILKTLSEKKYDEEAPGGKIAEFKRITMETQSLNEALHRLSSNGSPFVLFMNERTSRLSVVYRRGKDRYGLVEVEE